MAGNPMRLNQSLYYKYYQDQGHTTEDYRNLWEHLDQLVRERKLKQLLHHSSGQGSPTDLEPRRDAFSKPSLVTINVIFVALGRIGSCPSRVMFVTRLSAEDNNLESKRESLISNQH